VDDAGKLVVRFRLYDVFAGQELGQGLQLVGTTDGWRRIAHKVADQVYTRLTGESPYFDSRVVFVAETGPKDARQKRLAIMDYDGANVSYLTDAASIVLAPRFSPTGDRVLYTSYESGFPRIYVLDVASAGRRVLQSQDGTMSFAPRFAPDGRTVVYSLTSGGNTDLYAMDIGSGQSRRLSRAPSIETAPSFSPDGSRIVFESDRSGTPQLYIMPAGGGEAQRISFGQGRYGTPVWSPRGDLIAFTKQSKGRFHIGVMRTDGSEERLLTASFLDEGPTWSPNGRVIMFTRETQGAQGRASLYSVDITGRNLRQVPTETGASDPSWSPLQK
jgi:TolB protein